MVRIECANSSDTATCGDDCALEAPDPQFAEAYAIHHHWSVCKHSSHALASGVHTLYFCSWACQIAYGMRQLPTNDRNDLMLLLEGQYEAVG